MLFWFVFSEETCSYGNEYVQLWNLFVVAGKNLNGRCAFQIGLCLL